MSPCTPPPRPAPKHSCSLLTRNGAGRGITIDLLTPDQLLVQVDHLGEIIVSLQDLSWNRRRREARLKEWWGLWMGRRTSHTHPKGFVRGKGHASHCIYGVQTAELV